MYKELCCWWNIYLYLKATLLTYINFLLHPIDFVVDTAHRPIRKGLKLSTFFALKNVTTIRC